MPLARTPLTDGQILDVSPQFHNLAREFVTCNQPKWHVLLRPVIPVPDMQIGSADARLLDADEDIIRADLRNRPFLHPQAFRSFGFHQTFH